MKAEITREGERYVLTIEGEENGRAASAGFLADRAFACGCTEVKHSYDLNARAERIKKGEEKP